MSTATSVKNLPTKGSNTGSQETGYGPKYEFNLWKPNKDGKGAAALFSYNEKNKSFWLKMMPQKEGDENSKSFDNTRSFSIKLGITDLGSLLSVLNGRTEGIGKKNDKGYWSGIFHESDKGSSTIDLSFGQYGLRLSASQKTGEGAATRYSIGITPGEQECLRVFFEKKLPDMFVNVD